MSIAALTDLSAALSTNGLTLIAIKPNLIDLINNKVPPMPREKIFVLGVEYTGKSVSNKLQDLRETLVSLKANAFVATSLDEIAWLFNLRGQDIPYNPVFFAYAYVSLDNAVLYVDSSKFNEGVQQHLNEASVSVKGYEEIYEDLRNMKKIEGEKTLISKNCNWSLAEILKENKMAFEPVISPITKAKAIKNKVEIQGIKEAHLKDGVALVKFFAWLEHQILQGKDIDEIRAAEKQLEFRKEQKNFVGLSFETISASGSNAAIIHYRPNKNNPKDITRNQVYLNDSGAQYLEGTTDVTRVWYYGEVDQNRETNTTTAGGAISLPLSRAFTRVLQGHIELDTLVFPNLTTTGFMIDPIARTHLWSDGVDYRHGTGHGIGSFLNVHEGPHGIGTRVVLNETFLEKGMTVTNEPGYYEEGNYGIRIENVMFIVSGPHPSFLGFEHLTYVPIQTRLIDTTLLTQKQKDWVNNYHKECYEKLAPRLIGDEATLAWLRKETQIIV